MKFRPRVDRVIVAPLEKPKETESGLEIVREWEPDVMGTVVAVGRMSHPRKTEAADLCDALDQGCSDPDCDVRDCVAARMIRALTAREPVCQVGDTVLFSWTTGQEIRDEDADTRYLVLKEEDIFAVIEKEDAA